ncbi:P-loop containing nucleoside triphosphate hydrolase protein [Dipodascopsis tothii]|uniref:P-loop containing nucleoside triphosphate hydrolase protein n=1 Tax=Dipodascopsis tothii TaxID=44089 RepID=UPI0034CFD301
MAETKSAEVPPTAAGAAAPEKKYGLLTRAVARINPASKLFPPPVPEKPTLTPEATANYLSRTYFWWMNSLMKAGYKRPLQENDIYLIADERKAKYMTDKFLENLERRKAKGGKHVVIRAVNDTVFYTFWFAAFCRTATDIIEMCAPQLTRYIIYFVTDAYEGKPVNMGRGVGMIIGLTAMLMASSLSQNHYFYNSHKTGSHIKTILINALYRKSLLLSNRARVEFTNGKITNLMSTDTYRIEFACNFVCHLVDAPVPIIICLILLLINIGVSSLCGIALLFISSPLLAVVTKTIARRRTKTMVHTDARIRLMQEILQSMRIIKFFAWENAYVKKLAAIRMRELKLVKFMLILRTALFACSVTVPIFSSMISFIVLSVSGHSLNAAKVFSSLTLFNMLRIPLILLPVALATSADAYIAFGRIEKMLLAEESQEDIAIEPDMKYAIQMKDGSFVWEAEGAADAEEPKGKKGKTADGPGFFGKLLGKKPAAEPAPAAPAAVSDEDDKLSRTLTLESVQNAGLGRSEQNLEENITTLHEVDTDSSSKDEIREKTPEEPQSKGLKFQGLKNINLDIKRGELVVLTGFIGSGKSSLLAALVGEMRRTHGELAVAGSVAYCPQPWIQNTTLKENILFGREFDQDKYERVIRDCALTPDLESLPAGDMTEIGERGINISGGQKSRISLARAAYFDADIILLDDVLSAVDSHVGRHLVQECICGFMGGRTRLLATHQLHVLPYADRVIFMDGEGGLEIGTVDEITERCPKFAELMTYQQQGDEEEADEEEDVKPAAAPEKKKAAGKGPGGPGELMTEEEKANSSKMSKVYLDYYRDAGGFLSWGVVVVVLLVAVCASGAQILTNLWLSFWVNDTLHKTKGWYIGLYVTFGVVSALMFFTLGFTVTNAGASASYKLNNRAVERVLRSPMAFFDTSPLGRILNRFSKDVDSMDNTLIDAYRQVLITTFSVGGVFILILAYMYYFVAALVPLAAVYVFAMSYYRASARDVKRMDAVNRSFVFAHFNETLTGMTSIRAYREQDRFIERMEKNSDQMNRFGFVVMANQRWLSIRLELVALMMIFVTGMLAVSRKMNMNPSSVGLVLSYCMTILFQMSFMVRQVADVENDMNSVERLHYYATALESEAPLHIEETCPPKEWPQTGKITFEDVFLRYRPELPYVLKGISLDIKGGEKVGICGRTGAGKSSIMVALYRLAEISAGRMLIDDVDTAPLGLHDLRTKLAIIPQDPALFRGTIRSNLDPFDNYTDLELWDTLQRSGLMDSRPSTAGSGEKAAAEQFRSKFALDQPVDDEGLNFSLGERQLLALARALVRQSKILVLDEATSSVDYQTDAKIQKTIATEFAHCTILCIAHRLKTILSYDRILVLDDGRVAEFDAPKTLFMREGSIFHSLCQRSRITEADFA